LFRIRLFSAATPAEVDGAGRRNYHQKGGNLLSDESMGEPAHPPFDPRTFREFLRFLRTPWGLAALASTLLPLLNQVLAFIPIRAPGTGILLSGTSLEMKAGYEYGPLPLIMVLMSLGVIYVTFASCRARKEGNEEVPLQFWTFYFVAGAILLLLAYLFLLFTWGDYAVGAFDQKGVWDPRGAWYGFSGNFLRLLSETGILGAYLGFFLALTLAITFAGLSRCFPE
jgi:hypothetical protein